MQAMNISSSGQKTQLFHYSLLQAFQRHIKIGKFLSSIWLRSENELELEQIFSLFRK